ncbi:MAG: NUDIX hydrolase [Candidatus Staskawiczbacteria bacterium]|nr:NUDIX hydrolase [Candidatus Staskawiczbacteria bacterium]
MEILTRKIVFSGKFVRINKKTFKTKTGKTGVWEVVERVRCLKRIVIIFALTKDKKVVLEKNYRVPLETHVIELPAGVTDKEGESEEEAAKRELFEETGYVAKEMIEVFTSVGSPGLTNSEYVYFFAKDVEFVGKQTADDEEEIEVFTVPLEKLVDFVLEPKQDIKIDDKILNVLPVLKHKQLI